MMEFGHKFIIYLEIRNNNFAFCRKVEEGMIMIDSFKLINENE